MKDEKLRLKLELEGDTLEPQKLPSSVLYITDFGDLVVAEELVDNERVKKVTKKSNSGCNIRHWTNEEVEALKSYYEYYSTTDGGYIGCDDWYELLVEKLGLVLIQKSQPSDDVCSIGYSPKENKWYGWSHRAICGFGVGDKVNEGDLTSESGLTEKYTIQHPEEDFSLPVGYIAKDLNGAKRMAIAFAEAVS